MEATSNNTVEIVFVVVGALLGFLVFSCTLFFGIIYVLSRMGWAQLAEVYRHPSIARIPPGDWC